MAADVTLQRRRRRRLAHYQPRLSAAADGARRRPDHVRHVDWTDDRPPRSAQLDRSATGRVGVHGSMVIHRLDDGAGAAYSYYTGYIGRVEKVRSELIRSLHVGCQSGAT